MKIPFLEIGVSFAAGIILALFIPGGFWLWVLLFACLVALIVMRKKPVFTPLLWGVFILLGILHAQWDNRIVMPEIVKQSVRREFQNPAAVSGRVLTEPQRKIRGRRETLSFLLEADSLGSRIPSSRRMKYSKTAGRLQVFLNQPAFEPKIGDRLRLWGTLKPLEVSKNPAGFDYQRYLLNQDVAMIFTVYGKNSARLLKDGRWSFLRMISQMRQSLSRHIETLFRGEDAAFIKALILGLRKDISNTRNNEFLKTGTSHLLAISGLNIAMAAGSFYLLLLIFRTPQKIAALLSLGVTAVQVLLAGLGLPVQRAGIMAGAGFAALLLEREKNGLNLFFLSFFLLLWVDTRYLWNISFQLSFLSLFCLMIFPYWFHLRPAWMSAFVSTIAVIAGTFPLVVYHFNVFSPMGIIANLLGIPLFHWTLLSAFLALLLGKIPFLGPLAVEACHRILQMGLGWISFCSKPDWGYWFLAKPSISHLEFYYLSLGVYLLSLKMPFLKRKALQGIFLAAWLASFGAFFISPVRERFELTLLSAGSNEMAHIQFSKKNHWLLNAGRTFPGDQAQWILTPYLRALGLKEMTGILFTDWKKRHTSGLETLEEQFRFDYLVYPWPGKAALEQAPGNRRKLYLQYGDKIKMPEGSIEILEQYKAGFLFRIRQRAADFLFLYAVPHQDGKFLKPADVLVLPSEFLRFLESDLERWIGKVRPKLIVSPRPGKWRAENTLQLDLETYGAITLVPEITGSRTWLQIQTKSGKSFELPLRN